MRSLLVGVGVVVLVLTLQSIATAQPKPDPLGGVRKVTVLVLFGPTGTPPNGISEGRLQTILELRLRTAGLRVLTREEDNKDPDINPYVYLEVATLETSNQAGTVIGYAHRLDLSARVFASVPFNRARAPMVLWSNGLIAVADRLSAAADIERIVNNLADEFLNAWLKANPR